jgi:hypothetical protein
MKIHGKIIRILDKKTVIIDLGKNNGVTDGSVFSILGDPEPVLDPFTKEELGLVSVVKAKVKAAQVHDKFTIASTKWSSTQFKFAINLGTQLRELVDTEMVDQGDLLVNSEDVQPWKAKSETPVKIGDIVEVETPLTLRDAHSLVKEQEKNIKSDDPDSKMKADKNVSGG